MSHCRNKFSERQSDRQEMDLFKKTKNKEMDLFREKHTPQISEGKCGLGRNILCRVWAMAEDKSGLKM